MRPSNEIMTNPQEAHYIQNSKPDTDCVYCEVHHYRKADGTGEAPEQYAECTCPAICKGLCSVDISATPSPFDCTVTCKGCKHYKGKSQLTLI